MKLNKIHKALISIQLAILLILPVSASIPVETYGVGKWRLANNTNWYDGSTSMSEQLAIESTNEPAIGVSFDIEQGKTYKITWNLYISSTYNGSFTDGGTYINPYPLVENPSNVPKVESVTTIYKQNGILTVEVLYHADESYGKKYLTSVLDKTSSAQRGTKLSIAEYSIEVETDPDQEYYLEQLLEILKNIQSDNENYHTNALDILNNMFNYGSDYPLPSGGDELASSQNALSEAEGAISDKSSSIKEQISGQVQSNLELASSSADQVKQDSVQIKQLYATVTSSLPDEVKLLFVVVPLLLFVGWLIGRVRQ